MFWHIVFQIETINSFKTADSIHPSWPCSVAAANRVDLLDELCPCASKEDTPLNNKGFFNVFQHFWCQFIPIHEIVNLEALKCYALLPHCSSFFSLSTRVPPYTAHEMVGAFLGLQGLLRRVVSSNTWRHGNSPTPQSHPKSTIHAANSRKFCCGSCKRLQLTNPFSMFKESSPPAFETPVS